MRCRIGGRVAARFDLWARELFSRKSIFLTKCDRIGLDVRRICYKIHQRETDTTRRKPQTRTMEDRTMTTTTAPVVTLNEVELNALVCKVTAFFSLAELLKAAAGGYRPTLRGVPATKAKSNVAFAAAETLLANELEARGVAVFRGNGR
jgi:hypothetical protein